MKTPSCYNRDPFTDPSAGWVRSIAVKWKDLGPAQEGQLIPRGAVFGCGPKGHRFFQQKAIYRYRWPWFTDRCAAWDGPKVSETVPARECWACDGCKWLPAHARAWIRGEDDCD